MLDMTPQRPEPAEMLDAMETARWRFYGACLMRKEMTADASLDPIGAWAKIKARFSEELQASFPGQDVSIVLGGVDEGMVGGYPSM